MVAFSWGEAEGKAQPQSGSWGQRPPHPQQAGTQGSPLPHRVDLESWVRLVPRESLVSL